MADKKVLLTGYEAWRDGIIGGFGSFDTSLLQTYRLADSTNQRKLKKAFPEWFEKKSYFTKRF